MVKGELSDARVAFGNVDQKNTEPIKINVKEMVVSIAFLDEKRIASSHYAEKRMRLWRVEDGGEVSTAMDARDVVCSIAVSKDGEWVANGINGRMVIWNATSQEKVIEIKGHSEPLYAMDFSMDKTRIVTGSDDKTVKVWSLPTGKLLFGPLEHSNDLAAVKFSPDGQLIATATYRRESVRIYQNGWILFDFSIRVPAQNNQTIAWADDSKRLFVLSQAKELKCLDATTGTTLSTLRMPTGRDGNCVALSSNGAYIAISARSSISFWDAMTHEQIGRVSQDDPHPIVSMAITADHRIAVAGSHGPIILRHVGDILPSLYCDKIDYRKTVQSLRENVTILEQTIKQLDHEKESLNETIRSLHADLHAHDETFRAYQERSNQKADNLAQIIQAYEQRNQCEALYAQGQVYEATQILLPIENLKDSGSMGEWLADFKQRCATELEKTGDEALKSKKRDEAVQAYSTALSLSPPNVTGVLIKWLKLAMVQRTVLDTLCAAAKFNLPPVVVYREFCDILEAEGRVMDAVECFQHVKVALQEDTSKPGNEQAQWENDFLHRCSLKLEAFGDSAADSNKHTAAIAYYAYALALGLSNKSDIVIKCCGVRARWLELELSEADKSISSDPSSYKGYERRHAALHRMGRFRESFEAFQTMLSVIDESADPEVRKLRQHYVDVTPTIQRCVYNAIRNMPRVLINTDAGRLYDKAEQAAMFENLPIFDELRSSMTMKVNDSEALIGRAVKKFYQYVMLSHRWEDGEPLFQAVEGISVYNLETSPANLKLQTFCKLARSLGFHWVWSDTCCIDKKDNVVLQESLVAMFTWYRGSSLTIIYLRGVFSKSQKPGALQRSVWNTRGWTYQEYVAAQTVQFYTEDWKHYLGLKIYNHKESAQVVQEMQLVAGALTRELIVLRPDLDMVREKLYVASRRQTTVVEDAAYSLFGIFNAAIPVIYGEGNRALGRLLEHVLTGSGDITILAWTGHAGSYNSCLPVDLAAYKELEPPHVPPLVEQAEMDHTVMTLRSSLPNTSDAMKLYKLLCDLPLPSLIASRLRIHGITFPVTRIVQVSSDSDLRMYRATTAMLGDVDFKSEEDLSGMDDLVLMHPWVGPLVEDVSRRSQKVDPVVRAWQLVVRLKQPFGALLLAPQSRMQYKRVAADSLIMVRIREEVSLSELIEGIRPVDVQ